MILFASILLGLCIETSLFIANTGGHSIFLDMQLAKCFTVDKDVVSGLLFSCIS